MFVISEIIKELFALILNRITARIRCVSSTTVVLNAKLLDRLLRTLTKGRRGPNKLGMSDVFVWLKDKHKTSFAVLIMHAITGLSYSSMIYVSQ